ncbi:glycosyltransferase family 2 protein [Loktanella sp. M215]|uniref:glycosyltransferase family 2 protein n=1 Tax=Loktanella sp. M215 TaxID=2675431 RepID=UPI001F1EB4D5|nr:glycosyltransferase family 2 protein [Loktanella sp. M215]MCF7698615.1 glycosyltransferase [Loktanella sp. M215]
MTPVRLDAPEVSIVSPVYGCRDCLAKLVARVTQTMDNSGLTWELILVDDNAPDRPWPLILELTQNDPRIRGVRLTRNHGQHLAIWAGLEVCRGAWTAVIDCDLQDDPAVLPALFADAQTNTAHALIVDRGEWSDSWFRRAASAQFYRMIKVLAGIEIKNVGNFGVYSRTMVNSLLKFREQEVFLPMMVALTGLPVAKKRVDRSGRAAGQSSYSILRLLRLALAIVVRFSDRPLKLSAVAGFAFSSLAAVVSLCLFMGRILNIFTVAGWTSVILSVWFLSGLIMVTLGIHGLYIGRIFAEVRGRPRLSVMHTTFEPDGRHPFSAVLTQDAVRRD